MSAAGRGMVFGPAVSASIWFRDHLVGENAFPPLRIEPCVREIAWLKLAPAGNVPGRSQTALEEALAGMVWLE